MKRILLSIILALLIACAPAQEAKPDEKIKIGVSTPHTGPAAATGNWIRNGIELALERLSQGDREKIELLYEDDQCNPTTGMNVANKFAEIENIKFMMGPLCGAIVNPTMPYYEEKKILRMLPGVGLESNIGKGDYYFILLGRAESLMKKLADYAYENNIKTVSIIYIDDEYGKDNLKWFEKYFNEIGGKILAKESYVRGDTDFRTQLTKIKQTDPEAIFLISYGPTLVNILKQMKELGIETKKLSLINTEDTEIVKSAQDLTEGILYSSIIDSTESEVKAWFQQRYQEKFGAPPEAVAASSFDSFNVLYFAIRACNQDVECVKQTISQTKDYVGASGTVTLDQQRVGILNPAIKIVKDGKFVFVG
jgi:branched-chain amino acid transport system substrate-binding protein